jgi:hypothetical protein
MIKRLLGVATALAGLLFLVLGDVGAPEVALAVPANDNLASAQNIDFQPFTDRMDITGATTEVGEATAQMSCPGGGFLTGTTVWFQYRHLGPSQTLQVDTLGSASYLGSPPLDATLAVFKSASFPPTHASLSLEACNDQEFGGPWDAGLTFFANSGDTYYIQAGTSAGADEGPLVLNMSPIVSLGGAIFTVNSSLDSGDPDGIPDGICKNGMSLCTLREAIEEANANPTGDAENILFNIPCCPATINVSTALPIVTSPVNIEARTNDGFVGTPVVRISGAPTGDGLSLDSGSSVRGLAINGFIDGVFASGDGNVLQGNYIGVDVSGTTAAANQIGVALQSSAEGNTIGGTTKTARNVVSGNSSVGVGLVAGFSQTVKDNRVLGNYIGVDATGISTLGNGTIGVFAFSGPGSTTSGNVIGGPENGAGNTISGNVMQGVAMGGPSTTGNQVLRNYIGTDATGGTDKGNTLSGILFYAGASSNQVSSNVISGNDGLAGVSICGAPCDGVGSGLGAASNAISGNLIGVAGDGTTPLGNSGHGIYIDESGGNNGFANTIANNSGAGVRILGSSATGNYVQGYITNNGGLGIDLGTAGVTPNDEGPLDDGDTGPNNLQNFPSISAAYTVSGTTTIKGKLDTVPSGGQYYIVFFANSTCDGTHGEGKTVVGDFLATVDGNGESTFTTTTFSNVPVGQFVTATAYSYTTGDLSEFSACRLVTADSDGDGVNDTDEVACGGDPNDPFKRPERIDGIFAGVSDDGDIDIDEALPAAAANFDCDGDGYTGTNEAGTPLCSGNKNDDDDDDALVNDGCPQVGGTAESSGQCSNAVNDDPGDDSLINDGCPMVGSLPVPGPYSEAQFKIGTSDQDACGVNGWPSDLASGGIPNSTNRVNLGDLTSFLAPARRLDSQLPDATYNQRWDIKPSRSFGKPWINIEDLTALFSGPSDKPPMLQGARAINGPVCPWAP